MECIPLIFFLTQSEDCKYMYLVTPLPCHYTNNSWTVRVQKIETVKLSNNNTIRIKVEKYLKYINNKNRARIECEVAVYYS